MKSLYELVVDYQSILSDEEIIVKYFVENNIEDRGLTLLPKLAEEKCQKLQKELDYAKTWGCCLTDMNEVVKDKEVAKLLNRIQLHAALGKPLSESVALFAHAQETIPNIEVPRMFFMPAIGYLHKYDIHFKNEKDIDDSRIVYPLALSDRN